MIWVRTVTSSWVTLRTQIGVAASGELAVTAITMAGLAAGPHATTDPAEWARRPIVAV
jgi:hypothetical protein